MSINLTIGVRAGWCLPILCLLTCSSAGEDSPSNILIENTTYRSLDCYRISTPNATYLLDKVGAGLARMIDRDGKDWLSFDPKEGSGAAGEYRGFPNAVYKEQGNYFHASNASTDPCITNVEHESADRVVISATSPTNHWGAEYTFTETACTFTLTKKPSGHNYWVLYEGTPGGVYDDSDWWMTKSHPEKQSLLKRHNGDIPGGSRGGEWIAFGDQASPRMLVLTNHQDDSFPDHFYPMEKKMTVFGFGRSGMTKHLSSVPQSFSIGFVESDDVEDAQRFSTAVIHQTKEHSENRPKVTTAKRFAQHALKQSGNVKAGEKLFHDRRTNCSTCHRIGAKGGKVGPDLSNVGGKFDRPHLIDSLLYPSRQIGYGYESTIIQTSDGKIVTGVAKETSDAHVHLLDANNESIKIAKANIELSRISDKSIMPDGLTDSLTVQEFTDLISFLETLGRGMGSPGGRISGPVGLPDDFELTTVASGLSGAVAMEIAPDGRVFICEQGGSLRVVENGVLLREPFVTIPVEMNWERGLIGVTVSPQFPDDAYVYVVYVSPDPYSHHRISRFRASGNVAVANSEEVLFRGDDQSKFGGKVPAGHQGGAIHFGPDGKLYIGIGEQTAGAPAQQLNALQGKILRLNPDGSIPDDNPFLESTRGKYRAIWAMGCRNPFTFAFGNGGSMMINDVGGKFEEINPGVSGANYGWPGIDHGKTDKRGITNPLHIYPQSSINGGDFCDAESWPSRYRGMYFFADFNQGWVRFIDPSSPEKSHEFVSGIRRPVDIRFAPNGDLYVLLRNAWIVDKNFEGGTGSLVRIAPIER